MADSESTARRRVASTLIQIGDSFGDLTVVGDAEPKICKRGQGFRVRPRLLCRCACGKDAVAYPSDLRAGKRASCGCRMTTRHPENQRLRPGQKIQDLTALRQAQPLSNGAYSCRAKRRRWLFRCVCGCEVVLREQPVLYGLTKSCGCRKIRRLRERMTHGEAGYGARPRSKEYQIWAGMLDRCRNPNGSHYANYGGRGIRVCKRWSGSGGFENFLSDMGRRPGRHLTIDRIDTNGPYSPENCRWATQRQQSLNKTNTRWVTVKGERMPFVVACERFGITKAAASSRFHKRGWSEERTFLTPMRKLGAK